MTNDDSFKVNPAEQRKPRWLFIILIVIGGLGLIVLAFASVGNKRPTLPSTLPNAETPVEAKLGEEVRNSDGYRSDLKVRQETDAAQAREAGRSAVPEFNFTEAIAVPLTPEQNYVNIPASTVPSPSFGRLTNNITGSRQPEQSAVLRSIMSRWTPPVGGIVTPFNNIDIARSPSIESALSTSSQPVPDPKLPILIEGGQRLYAVIATGANSDVGGPVTATLLATDHGEATLIGSFERRNDLLGVNFNRIKFKGRSMQSINAVALSLNNLSPGIRSSVDRRLLQRYIAPFLASFVGGVGEAIALGSRTTSVINGVPTIVEDQNLSIEDQLLVGAGTAGAVLAEDLRKQSANVQQLVKLDVNEGIVVLFLEDVRG